MEPTRNSRTGKWLALALFCDLDERSLLNRMGEVSVYFSTRQSSSRISLYGLTSCCLIREGTQTITLESSSGFAIRGCLTPRQIPLTRLTIQHLWRSTP